MTVEETIKKSYDIIRASLPSSTVYLFGSRARGLAHKYSDIDIAIESESKIKSKDILDIKSKLENLKSMFEVQVVDLQVSSDKFRSGVMSYAKELNFNK